MPTLQEYLDLLPAENDDKPNFLAVLTAILQGLVDTNNQILTLYGDKFDLDTAVGQQLDFVGQWVGLPRQLYVPISGVYFSFDTEGVGFDQGVWLGPFDNPSQLVYLDDETYRQMLILQIAANHWDGSLAQAQEILRRLFSPSTGTFIFVQDNFDMTMTVGIGGTIPSELFLQLVVSGYFTLRPAAVGVNYVVTTVDGDSLFGFDNDNDYIRGFDEGAWGEVLSP